MSRRGWPTRYQTSRIIVVGNMSVWLAAALIAWVAIACVGNQSSGQKGVSFTLYTHCGILYADFEGTRYYADPPLSDGNGNPPRSWGNPFDDGTMTVVDATTVKFTDLSGNQATFSTHPRSGIPIIQLCD